MAIFHCVSILKYKQTFKENIGSISKKKKDGSAGKVKPQNQLLKASGTSVAPLFYRLIKQHNVLSSEIEFEFEIVTKVMEK